MTRSSAIQTFPSGVRLSVRLTPRAGRDAIGQVVHDPEGRAYISVRVAAPPVDGQANRALTKLIANAAGAPKSAVAFVSGEGSRLKVLTISGDGPTIGQRLIKAIGN